jgi:hypothetical protein
MTLKFRDCIILQSAGQVQQQTHMPRHCIAVVAAAVGYSDLFGKSQRGLLTTTS